MVPLRIKPKNNYVAICSRKDLDIATRPAILVNSLVLQGYLEFEGKWTIASLICICLYALLVFADIVYMYIHIYAHVPFLFFGRMILMMCCTRGVGGVVKGEAS